MYCREDRKFAEISNTGVMIMNVNKFEEEFPLMLDYAKRQRSFPGQDQELINMYKNANDWKKEKFMQLPMQYNWKAYWGLAPSIPSQIKILHQHGPKQGRGLESMAMCNYTVFDLDDDINPVGAFPA